MKNFTRIFSDERAVNSLIHSLYFTVLETPTQIIVGLLAAVALSKNTRFNRFCRSTFYIPVICSLTSIAIIFPMLLDPECRGDSLLVFTSRLADPSLFFRDPTLAMPTVAIMTVWKNFWCYYDDLLLDCYSGISPLCMNLLKWMVQQIDSSFNITLPQIVPSLGFCIFNESDWF